MSDPANEKLMRLENIQSAVAPATNFGALSDILRSAWTVFRFENRRSRTWGRLLIWLIVVLFPGTILLMMRLVDSQSPQQLWISLLFVSVTEMVVILNALLWVAPLIQTELEGKTWLYVAIRPFGRMALTLGKGWNGLSWTLSAGLSSLALAVVLLTLSGVDLTPPKPVPMRDAVQTARFPEPEIEPSERSFDVEDWPETAQRVIVAALQSAAALAALTVLSTIVYSPLFAAIGCIAPRRAMLIAFSYTLIFEVLIALIPAVVNRITVQYHLRCLLTKWIDLGINDVEGRFLSSQSSPAWHVGCLLTMSLLWTVVSLTVVHFRTYVTNDEA